MSTRTLRPLILSENDIRRFHQYYHKQHCGCWNWRLTPNPDGYGIFKVKRDNFLAHRVAYIIANGDTSKLILHTCDNPLCVNPKHLYAGSDANNGADRVTRGRSLRGEDHGASKLTNSQVKEIRRLYKPRVVTQYFLAAKFNVSQPHISAIIRGIIR